MFLHGWRALPRVAMLARYMLSSCVCPVGSSFTRRYCQLYSFNLHDIFSVVWRQDSELHWTTVSCACVLQIWAASSRRRRTTSWPTSRCEVAVRSFASYSPPPASSMRTTGSTWCLNGQHSNPVSQLGPFDAATLISSHLIRSPSRREKMSEKIIIRKS